MNDVENSASVSLVDAHTYNDFLASKCIADLPSGLDVSMDALPSTLFDFQAHLVRWALRRGRAGLFTGTGTGKTAMQLAWAAHIPGLVLILAPLCVTQQTIREAQRMQLEPVQYVRTPADMRERICITNYDMLHAFQGVDVAGIVLDEASIIKSFSGATRKTLIANFTTAPYRLCCTATPAPNSVEEIGNYAEWLGVMTLNSMRAMFFVHDETGWRIHRHAIHPFYRWLASWAMTLRGPADLGFDGTRFALPPLRIHEHFLPWDDTRLLANGEGQLGIPGVHKLQGVGDRAAVRAQTTPLRVAHAKQIVQEATGQVVVWCGLNEESTSMMRTLGPKVAVEIKGSDTREVKEDRLMAFLDGQYKVLISKASLTGFGINMQNASTAIFLGLNDSWESYYQAVRRVWRYGQTQPVETHIVMSEHERPIWANVQRKEQEANTMIDGLIHEVQSLEQAALGMAVVSTTQPPTSTVHADTGWSLYHGDCVEGLAQIPDASVGLTVFSPPFSTLFQYNASERDLGNCQNTDQFFTHFRYVTDQLMRIMQPGRTIAMHLSQIPAMLVRDGWIGLHDFRGQMTSHMVREGWIYSGEVSCGKSPQAQAVRVKAKGLAFHQLESDSAWSRPCLGDYICLYRKPGENVIPVHPDIDRNTWIRWACNIWYSSYYDKEHGYSETKTLNVAEARDPLDTKHICPLPIDLVERCIRLWSNPGETVCDPFTGIGTTGVVALQHGRQFVGCELKDSYVRTARKNLAHARQAQQQSTLFSPLT